MMNPLALLVVLAQTVAPVPWPNVAPVPTPPSPASYPQLAGVDRTFAQMVSQSGATEIRMAHLALARTSVHEVQGFAQKMIDEHTEMAQAFAPAVRHVLGTAPPTTLSPADQLAYRHLETLSTADFDQNYLMAQIGGHLATLAAFQAEADNGTDPRLKELAKRYMPTIQSHLELALNLTQHVGGASPFKSH